MNKLRNYWNHLEQTTKNRILSITGICVIVIFCLFSAVAWPRISGKPLLVLNGESEVVVAAGTEFLDEGADATLLGKSVSDSIYVTGKVDTSVPGTYEIGYHVDGRWKTYTVTRKVIVEDQTAPEITLNGDSSVTVEQIEEYQEQGASVQDNCDGDLTSALTEKMEQINDYTYQVIYEASDAAGNTGTAARQVVIHDTVPPEISLNGEASVTIKEREKFDDPGAEASDDRDGDLSGQIVRSGYVDIYRPGTYMVTYTVSDAGGNQVQTEREVVVERVYSNPANAVYLTFDDGPSPDVTERILNTLAANNIKATFFICDYNETTLPLLKRMVAEGHTIGIHGYSHDYQKIYASTDAFMDNIYKLKDKLKQDTGYDAFCMRFPGGSSNTVSKEYSPGIMTNLVQMMTDNGMMYVDWNVSSEDATGYCISAKKIVASVCGGLKKGRSNIVLMHDTSVKQTTADALQKIIDYGKCNGYSFYPITADTVPVHQRVLN